MSEGIIMFAAVVTLLLLIVLFTNMFNEIADLRHRVNDLESSARRDGGT
jgi:hypothetical protein